MLTLGVHRVEMGPAQRWVSISCGLEASEPWG